MKTMKIYLALAALSGIAGAQNAADTSAAALKEKIDAVEGRVDGLNESYLETKTTVAGLAKLKISGLIQAQATYNLDTAILSSGRPTQQTQFLVRRGRIKAAYDAGNGSTFVTQYDIKQSGLTPQDIYVKFDEPWLKTFSLQAGLQDIPFGYEIGYSSSTMEWLERSRFERQAMFKDEKDVGFILGISPKVPGLDAASLKLAYLNGTGISDLANNATFDPQNFVGRLNLSKNLYDAGLGLNLGGSFYTDVRKAQAVPLKNKAGTADSVANYNVIDGTQNNGFKRFGFRDDLRANVYGADAQITYDDSYVPGLAGLKLMGELYTGSAIGTSNNNQRSVVVGDVLYKRNVLGYYLAFVQNVDKLAQVVVRFDVYDPNTDVSKDEIGNAALKNGTSAADLAYTSWFFGLNVFLNANTKVALGYDLVANEKSANLANTANYKNFAGVVNADVLTARLQFAF